MDQSGLKGGFSKGDTNWASVSTDWSRISPGKTFVGLPPISSAEWYCWSVPRVYLKELFAVGFYPGSSNSCNIGPCHWHFQHCLLVLLPLANSRQVSSTFDYHCWLLWCHHWKDLRDLISVSNHHWQLLLPLSFLTVYLFYSIHKTCCCIFEPASWNCSFLHMSEDSPLWHLSPVLLHGFSLWPCGDWVSVVNQSKCVFHALKHTAIAKHMAGFDLE